MRRLLPDFGDVEVNLTAVHHSKGLFEVLEFGDGLEHLPTAIRHY
jgi:hypothetical protein